MPKSKLPSEDIDLGPKTFLVALDETGNEEFDADKLFGLVGVIGPTAAILRADARWRAMKAEHFGASDAEAHATTMMTPAQLRAISQFFEKNRVGRFAYLLEAPPIAVSGLNALKVLLRPLVECLAEAIGSLPALPDEVVICIENSDRLRDKIVALVPGIQFTVDGQKIPMKGLFTNKRPPQPVLEMADHIAHRAQRQYKHPPPGGALYPEFVSVFPEPGARHAKYQLLRIASLAMGSNPRQTIEIDPNRRVRLRFDW